ncbi:MAG: tetratricopeptide repeat protein [Erysipelotrichaceae bacterium]|nr:tetratricopeptide repeat protein [Erysipelotrichaceae bacterium]
MCFNNNSKNRINWLKIIMLLIVAIFCLVLLITIYQFHKAIFSGKVVLNPDTAVGGSIMEISLGVFALVVSVWSVLNITNTLDKKEIDEAKEARSKIVELTDDIDIAKSSITDVTKSVFLQRLLNRDNSDEMRYLYSLFDRKGIETELTSEDFNDMAKIEHYYAFVKDHHSSIDKKNIALSEAVYEGLNLIKEIKNRYSTQKMAEELKYYLLLKEGSFYFYNGYSHDINSTEHAFALQDFFISVDRFKEFLENIRKKVEFLELDNNVFTVNFNKPEYSNERITIGLVGDIIGSIGEAYSKIIYRCTLDSSIENISVNNKNIILDNDGKKTFADLAVSYCSEAVKIMEKLGSANEIEYRNLACAYERQGRLEGFEKTCDDALTYFRKVIDCSLNSVLPNTQIRSAYHAVLSFYNRLILYKLTGKTNPVDKSLGGKESDGVDNYITAIKNSAECQNESVAELIEEMESFGKLAVKDNSRIWLNHNMLSFSILWKLLSFAALKEKSGFAITGKMAEDDLNTIKQYIEIRERLSSENFVENKEKDEGKDPFYKKIKLMVTELAKPNRKIQFFGTVEK